MEEEEQWLPLYYTMWWDDYSCPAMCITILGSDRQESRSYTLLKLKVIEQFTFILWVLNTFLVIWVHPIGVLLFQSHHWTYV